MLGISGIVVAFWKKEHIIILLAVVPLSLTVIYAVHHAQHRFMVPAMPIMIISSLYFLKAASTTLITNVRWRNQVFYATLVFLVLGVSFISMKVFDPRFRFEYSHRGGPSDHSWTIMNPNDNAIATKVRFANLSLDKSDSLFLLDEGGRVWQEIDTLTLDPNGWSSGIPGNKLVVHLLTGLDRSNPSFLIDSVASDVSGSPFDKSGETVSVSALATFKDQIANIVLDYSAPESTHAVLGVDVYSASEHGLEHYGWWAIPVTQGPKTAELALNLVTKQANAWVDGKEQSFSSETWPTANGRYMVNVQLKYHERLVSARSFGFLVEDGEVRNFDPSQVSRITVAAK